MDAWLAACATQQFPKSTSLCTAHAAQTLGTIFAEERCRSQALPQTPFANIRCQSLELRFISLHDRGVDAPAPTAPQPVSHTPGEGVNVETCLKDDGNSSRMMLLLSGQRSLCLAEVWHKWSDLRLLDHEPLWHAHAKRNPAKASESRCQCHAPGRCQQQWKFFLMPPSLC